MRPILFAAALALALGCSDDKQPTASGSTGSASGGGNTMCTNDLGEVSGVLSVDEHDGSAPSPSPDTEITFVPDDGSPGITAKSDATGGYAATLPAGLYTVLGSPGRCAPIPEPEVTVVACESVTLDLALELCLGNGG